MQVRIHSNLSSKIISSKNGDLHRAYAVWLTLRTKHKSWHYYHDLVTEFSELSGKSYHSIRRWLIAGEGIFWEFGNYYNKKTISLIGKDRVFRKFELRLPGKIYLVEIENLFKSLQSLRAHISLGWMNGKDKKWISREKISGIIDKTTPTQLHYEKHTKQKKKAVIVEDMRAEYSDYRRLPNIYCRAYFTLYKSKRIKRYGYSLDNKTQDIHDDKKRRILFDNKSLASRAIKKREIGEFVFYQNNQIENMIICKSLAYV